MLRKQYRLRHSGRITEVRKRGDSYRNQWLALSKLSSEQMQSRFAFSVSGRIGDAVIRNRVKRLMREAVRQHLSHIGAGWDVLLIARPRASRATYEQIARATIDVLQQSRLWMLTASTTPTADGSRTARE